MDQVVKYLELKNQYYEKYYQMTIKFLDDSDDKRWQSLDHLVSNRQRILNIVRTFDHKIARRFQDMEVRRSVVNAYKDRVQRLLEERARWISKIVEMDLLMISLVDQLKSQTIRELRQAVDVRDGLKHFEDHLPKKRSRTS